jgi:Uroporphyrinogen decarboxylase (URO-D)
MPFREAFAAIMGFEKPDLLPQFEWGYWPATIDRWRTEGLPPDCQPWDHFSGITWYEHAPVDMGLRPWFEPEVLKDEGETYVMRQTDGAIVRRRKDELSMPQWLDFPVKSRRDYERIRERLDPRDPGRYPADWPARVEAWKTRDHLLTPGCCAVGFFGWFRTLMGVENLLLTYCDDPSLMHAMCRDHLEFLTTVMERELQEVDFDFAFIWEDMAYKGGPLIGPAMVREFMLPYYRQLLGFLRAHGTRLVLLDSDGDISLLIPLFTEVGVDGLVPFEVAAGLDVRRVREEYPRLRILGGVDKRALAQGKGSIDAELEAKLPFMFDQGGFLPSADHHIPPNVSLECFEYYLRRCREIYAATPLGRRSR